MCWQVFRKSVRRSDRQASTPGCSTRPLIVRNRPQWLRWGFSGGATNAHHADHEYMVPDGAPKSNSAPLGYRPGPGNRPSTTICIKSLMSQRKNLETSNPIDKTLKTAVLFPATADFARVVSWEPPRLGDWDVTCRRQRGPSMIVAAPRLQYGSADPSGMLPVTADRKGPCDRTGAIQGTPRRADRPRRTRPSAWD